jgi:pimeloyl-ACP methyl ester carboxylesterase
MRTTVHERTSPTGVHIEEWGEGTRVVLVHGSLATAAEEWVVQHPLGDQGFHFVAPDRRGYGRSPSASGEDFLRDAEDIADLLGDGAHLVGHSYGGLGVLLAAARRPEATLSIALLEPATTALGQDDPAARALQATILELWDSDLDDAAWVVRFLKTMGSDPDEFPPDFLEVARPLVPLIRHGRRFSTPDLPLAEVAAASFPKLVVSGGHSAALDAICDDLAERIGGRRAVAAGAGHEVQFAPTINEVLVDLWRSVG